MNARRDRSGYDAGAGTGLWWLVALLLAAPALARILPRTAPWLPAGFPVLIPLAAAVMVAIAGGVRAAPRFAWHPGVMPPLAALAACTAAGPDAGWIGLALLGVVALGPPGAPTVAAGAAILGTAGWVITGLVDSSASIPGVLSILLPAVASPLAVVTAAGTRSPLRRLVWIVLGAGLVVAAWSGTRAVIRPRPTATLRPRAPDHDRLGDAVGRRALLGWQALVMLRERPFAGAGSGSFGREQAGVQAEVLAGPRREEWRSQWTRATTPGGEWLRLPAELGLAGTGLAIWLAVAAARCAGSGWRRARGPGRVAVAGWSVAGVVLAAGSVIWSPLTVPATAALAATVLGALAAADGGPARVVVLPWPATSVWRIAAATGAMLAAVRVTGLAASPALAARETSLGLAAMGAPAPDLVTARARFTRAVRWDDASGEAQLALGTVEAALGDRVAAAFRFARARTLLGDERAPLAAGLAAREAGDRIAARRWLTEAIRLRPGCSTAHAGLAALDLVSGRRAAAISRYREAIRADPGNLEARRRLGLIFYHDRNWREAIDMLMPVYAANPDDPHVAGALDRIRERRFGGKS